MRVDLFGAEDLVGIRSTVVAAQAQSVAGDSVEVFDAQHPVMLKRIDLAVDDLGQAAVDGEGGAVGDAFGHAVADHGDADGVAGVYFQGFEVAAGQADGLVGDFGDVGFGFAGGDGDFLVERQFDVRGFHHAVDAIVFGRLIGGAGAEAQWGLRAFAVGEPFRADGQQAGDAVDAPGWDATVEPVVHVLGFHAV
ncbi:hypothetical protein D3C84_789450 [compost metagenome]